MGRHPFISTLKQINSFRKIRIKHPLGKLIQPLANGTITLHDILFGDVWICSGQSNMQMTVSLIFNATEEVQSAGNYPKLRLFTASLIPSAISVGVDFVQVSRSLNDRLMRKFHLSIVSNKYE